jgi:hypothetical protein
MNNKSQGADTVARNNEIERRLNAGESGTALAREYGISQPRVYQIARAVRVARGESAPARAKPAAAVAPRLRRDRGAWQCSDGIVARSGQTPKAAYDAWILAAIADAQPAAPAAPAKTEDPYIGPVTVVAGTKAGPRAFTLSPAMAMLAQRAREAQDPLHSLAGIRERLG